MPGQGTWPLPAERAGPSFEVEFLRARGRCWGAAHRSRIKFTAVTLHYRIWSHAGTVDILIPIEQEENGYQVSRLFLVPIYHSGLLLLPLPQYSTPLAALPSSHSHASSLLTLHTVFSTWKCLFTPHTDTPYSAESHLPYHAFQWLPLPWVPTVLCPCSLSNQWASRVWAPTGFACGHLPV